MSSEPLSGHFRHQWVRPMRLAYANHTCNFLCGQIIVWSRLLFAIGANVLLYADYLALLTLLSGVLLGLPYVILIFRESEVVVEGGPSLISDIIPEWVATASLLASLLIFWMADHLIGDSESMQPAWIIYMILSLFGLCISILSARNQKDRVLVSVVLLVLSLHEAGEFAEIPNRTILACACTLSYLFDAYEVQGSRHLIHPKELSVMRVSMVAKLCLAVSILFELLNPVSIGLIGLLFVLNCFVHVYERRWGNLHERACLQLATPRDIPLNHTDQFS